MTKPATFNDCFMLMSTRNQQKVIADTQVPMVSKVELDTGPPFSF